jgi:hypothetical protein
MKNNFNSHYMGYILSLYFYNIVIVHYKPMEILRIFCEKSKYHVSNCRWGINHKTTMV